MQRLYTVFLMSLLAICSWTGTARAAESTICPRPAPGIPAPIGGVTQPVGGLDLSSLGFTLKDGTWSCWEPSTVIRGGRTTTMRVHVEGRLLVAGSFFEGSVTAARAQATERLFAELMVRYAGLPEAERSEAEAFFSKVIRGIQQGTVSPSGQFYPVDERSGTMFAYTTAGRTTALILNIPIR
jgi:hypothetical protein